MKKYRSLLLALLLVVGIPTGLLVREYRQERLNQDLLVAIKNNDAEAVLTALKAGANPNTRYHPDAMPLSFGDHLKQLLKKILHPVANNNSNPGSTALVVHFEVNVGGKGDNPAIVKALLDAGADPNLAGGPECPQY